MGFHLTSYLLAISDYMGLVCGLLYGWCGRCMVHIEPSVWLSAATSEVAETSPELLLKWHIYGCVQTVQATVSSTESCAAAILTNHLNTAHPSMPDYAVGGRFEG